MQKKICCIRSVEEARIAIEAGADAIGFVGIHPPSPRTIDDELIAEITHEVPHSVATVLLTTATTAEAISRQLRRTAATSVQLSAQLEVEELSQLASMEPNVRRIKVVHVEGPEAIQAIEKYSDTVDVFLLDSGSPNATVPEYGGTGRQHDWMISAEFVKISPLPVFLAGGLNSQNVANAIRQVRPAGVDLCSGVRTGDKLDAGKLTAFMNAIKTAEV